MMIKVKILSNFPSKSEYLRYYKNKPTEKLVRELSDSGIGLY